MTPRIEPFLNMTHRIEPFFSTWLKEIEPLKKYDSKSFFFFWKNINMTQSMNWSLWKIWLQELNPFKIWLTELNFLKMTLRIEPFSIWFKELNPSFAKKKTHRVEYESKGLNPFWICLKELFPFLWNMSPRIVLFNMIQRIEPFFCKKKRLIGLNMNQKDWTLFEYDSKNWTFFFWNKIYDPKNWTHFQKKNDSKNWTLFEKYESKNTTFLTWITEFNLFLDESKNWTFYLNVTKELNFFFECDSNNWIFGFSNVTIWLKELNPFKIWFKELNPFQKSDSKKWTFFFLRFDSENWTFFFIWLYELNLTFFQKEKTEWFFFSKNGPLFTWLEELNLFFWNVTQRIEPFYYDLTNSNFFEKRKDSKILTFSGMWLKELSLVLCDPQNWTFFLIVTQRIELFF